jgi:Domain of unknown function (DUF4262)
MRELAAAGYGPEAYLRIITGQIDRIGWAVQGVPGDEQWPSWAYSIGLWHTFRVPELALFGLSLPNMAAIINALGRRIADGGTIAADDRIEGVCPCTFAIRPVHDSWRATSLFAVSDSIYGYLRPTYQQIIWPDRRGGLPWEPGFEAGSRASSHCCGCPVTTTRRAPGPGSTTLPSDPCRVRRITSSRC